MPSAVAFNTLNFAPATKGLVGFGMNDSKGREIGVSTTIRPYTVTAGHDGVSCNATSEEPGAYFSVVVHPTRNGERFGSSESKATCRTLADAEIKTAKLVEASRKRYAAKVA